MKLGPLTIRRGDGRLTLFWQWSWSLTPRLIVILRKSSGRPSGFYRYPGYPAGSPAMLGFNSRLGDVCLTTQSNMRVTAA